MSRKHEEGSGIGPASTRFFLPDPQLEDQLLREPPLAVDLSTAELDDLRNVPPDLAVAATFFGPPGQDKNANEDFALSALLRGSGGRLWTFAALADGVSTRTFWPARSSRLSCLVAYKTLRQALEGGLTFENASLGDLREQLVRNLRAALLQDRKVLEEDAALNPDKWSPESYQQYIGRNELWYNSTLLVACLGPKDGFILWAGDGGIELLKSQGHFAPGTDVETLTPLKSTEDLVIGTFVSLDVDTSHFSARKITYPAPSGTVQIYLSSDGVDRTLQRGFKSYRDLSLPGPHEARRVLIDLSKIPGCEPDNYSIAWLRTPPEHPAHIPQASANSSAPMVKPGRLSRIVGEEDEAEVEEEDTKRLASTPRRSNWSFVLKAAWPGFILSFLVGMLAGHFLLSRSPIAPSGGESLPSTPPRPVPTTTPASSIQATTTPGPSDEAATPIQAVSAQESSQDMPFVPGTRKATPTEADPVPSTPRPGDSPAPTPVSLPDVSPTPTPAPHSDSPTPAPESQVESSPTPGPIQEVPLAPAVPTPTPPPPGPTKTLKGGFGS